MQPGSTPGASPLAHWPIGPLAALIPTHNAPDETLRLHYFLRIGPQVKNMKEYEHLNHSQTLSVVDVGYVDQGLGG